MSNFTPRAQQVLALARKEADRLSHNFVGTEHLLLGLIALRNGTAVTVLEKLGLDLETVRTEVEKQVGTGPDQKMIGNIPYTPRVKKVLALAAREAKALNHTYIGTEHILLGLLREGDGVAARVLKNLDVDTEQTRQEILKELDPNYSPSADPVAASPQPTSTSPKISPSFISPKPPRREPIDISKRYDVYSADRNGGVVIYSNALFKGVKSLLPRNDQDALSEFIELEQSDGQIIFIARFSIIRFCESGVTPKSEETSGENT
jgi:ATP-dependent Clp protease ATP-binding subunit ClpA